RVCGALCHMSLVAWFEGTYAEGRELAERALKIATEVNSLPLLFSAKFLLASALFGTGNVEEAIALQREMSKTFTGELESARLGAAALPSSLVRAYTSWFMMEVGRYEEGLPHAEEALTIAKRHGEPYAELLARLGMGRNLIKLRRHQEATDCLKVAV